MRGRTLALLACVAGLALAAPAAQASPPAVGQYHLHNPSSGTAGPGGGTTPASDSSGGGSSAAVIILGAGLVAIAGGAGLVLWRRRPTDPRDAS